MTNGSLQLRDYQRDCVHRAIDANTVVCLKTGAGKTLVAVKVIDHFLPRQQIILFLVPTKALVKQQAEYCRKHCSDSPAVKEVCGLETDAWDQLVWQEILRKHRIIVGTPEPLRRALDHGFVNPMQLSLVILDECHRAIGKDPMAQVMYILKDRGSKPRILGLTASFFSGSLKRKRDAEKSRVDLEVLLDASFFCPDVPDSKKQEFKQVTWLEENSSSEDFLAEVQRGLEQMAHLLGEAAELKDFRKVGARMHHVLHQLGRQALEVYVKKCVVRQLQQHCEQLQQLEKLPAEERQQVEQFLAKLPMLQELTSRMLPELMKSPSLQSKPPISAKLESLSDVIAKEEGSKGIVFVEQVAVTVPLAAALQDVNIAAEAVYGELPKQDLEAALRRFKEGATTVLVSTNALEEGIDVADCTWVVRFDKIHTTKSHIQGSGRARSDAARIYYFDNDHHEEVSKEKVLTAVAKDHDLMLTEDQRRCLQSETVQEIPDVYPFGEANPIHLFNCQDIVTTWCQQALGHAFSSNVFVTQPELHFQIPTPSGQRSFRAHEVYEHWRDIQLEKVIPEKRLKGLSREERLKLKALYAVAVWLRRNGCLDEHNKPKTLQLELTKKECPVAAGRTGALRLNNSFGRNALGGPVAGDFKTKLNQLLQSRFPHMKMDRQLIQYNHVMESAGWISRVVIHLPTEELCECSMPCATKKEAEQAAARKAYEKLQC